MKIIAIGGFDKSGMPVDWFFNMESSKEKPALDMNPKRPELIFGVGPLELSMDGSFTVKVGGVEIVEWTEKRRVAAGEKK